MEQLIMNPLFGFLTDDATYTADIPQELLTDGEAYTVIPVRGVSHSVQYAPFARVDYDRARLKKRGTTRGRGREVTVYDRVEPPAQTGLYWRLSSGFIWTQIDPEIETGDSVDAVLNGLSVSEDRKGIPRLSVEGELSLGHRRLHVERDYVMYPSPSGFMVAFVDSRGLPPLPPFQAASGARSVVTTELGVDVHSGGPAGRGDDLESIAEQVAASLSQAVR